MPPITSSALVAALRTPCVEPLQIQRDLPSILSRAVVFSPTGQRLTAPASASTDQNTIIGVVLGVVLGSLFAAFLGWFFCLGGSWEGTDRRKRVRDGTSGAGSVGGSGNGNKNSRRKKRQKKGNTSRGWFYRRTELVEKKRKKKKKGGGTESGESVLEDD